MVSKMLGKLFSTAASSLTPRGSTAGSSRPTSSLESVQEDIHTHNLLFPDAEALYQHQHDQVFPLSSAAPNLTSSTNAFDFNPDIELDLRDVRVVIMQETTTLQGSAALLFDSQPLVEPTSSTDRQPAAPNASTTVNQTGGGRSITSPRRISLGQASKPVVITQESSVPRTFGAFDRRPSSHNRAPSYAETEKQRAAREYREEMTTFSNCIFGSSDIMAYKGTGTKVHIIPTEAKASSYAFEGQGSLGRSSIRSSRLAQSYTSENIAPGPTSAGLTGPGLGLKSYERKKVLITRIFPVALPNTEADRDHLTPTSQNEGSDSSSSYPFPTVGGDGKAQPGKKPRQKRTPMYAIGLIVNLPATTHLPSMPVSRSGFRGPSSYNEQESFPSSYSSLRPSGWTVLGHASGVDSLESSVFSDFDDRIDVITQHWDIIMRTLNHLQAIASTSVLALLKQVDLASPDPVKLTSSNPRAPVASVSISGKRVDETVKPFKLPGTNAKLVQLLPNALAYQQNIKKEVDDARQRIASGIKTLQVVTRQGRWGIWREEARWVSKWAGGREEGFFFYNLLTGFLGNHTDWLRALAPEPYRRHHYQQQRANRDEDNTVSVRTVIVANDKMAARRLIFLLSAFLPPNQPQQQFPYTRTHRPGTATSFDGYSQSPNSYLPTILKEDSLRRRVKRRNAPPRSTHSRTMSFQTQGSNTSPTKDHERQDSDAMSLKTANLPIPGSDVGSRKSSAATTTTVTPATTIPHFSTRRSVKGTGPIPRPGSSGSLATDDLIRSLKRGDSSSHLSNASSDLQGNSRWGSMISGFWSNKRRDSTSATDITTSPTRSDDVDYSKIKMSKSKLAEMVAEAQRQEIMFKDETAVGSFKTGLSFITPEQPAKSQQVKQEPRLVHPEGAYESVVKTSINEEDGVIDIDVPLPDFITSSFGSAMSSPSSSGYLSTQGFGPGLEGFEHYSRSGPDADAPINVGGWLPRYHPDFVLQAIPAQEGLEEEVKASMSAEPTPPLGPSIPGEVSRWIDICSTVIADATNFTIKRIRYRRHVMLRAARDRQNSGTFADARSQSLYGNPYITASQLEGLQIIEEDFVTDPVVSMEETLIDAVERMVSYSGSKPGSSSSSRPVSCHRGREGSDSTEKGAPHPVVEEPLKVPEGHLEVPRMECKKIVLGALEEIARQVAESRQDDSTAPSDRNEMVGRESFMREGVRAWLASVEDWEA
jgi:hypothetical protein